MTIHSCFFVFLFDTLLKCKPKSTFSMYIFQLHTLSLLTSKYEKDYKRLFRALMNLCPELKPHRMMLDFEKAVRNPARDVLGVENIAGCWFHFRQATMKKRRKFKINMIDDTNRKRIAMLDALAFLPVEQVTIGESQMYNNIHFELNTIVSHIGIARFSNIYF